MERVAASCMARSFARPSGASPAICGRAPGRRRTCICCFTKTARYYDADLFAIDIKRIGRWYNEKGFYEAKVENVEELRDDKGRVTLLVKINEGRRAVVRKMDFTGAEAVPHDELSDI